MDMKAFKKELRALMDRHGVISMGGDYDGDTHGIDRESFIITTRSDGRWVEHTLNPTESMIDARDLYP